MFKNANELQRLIASSENASSLLFAAHRFKIKPRGIPSSPVNENGVRVTRTARDALNQKQRDRSCFQFVSRLRKTNRIRSYVRYRSRLCRADYTDYTSRACFQVVNNARRDNENCCSNNEAGGFQKKKKKKNRAFKERLRDVRLKGIDLAKSIWKL